MDKPKLEIVHEGDERNTASWKYLHTIFHKPKAELNELKQAILEKKAKLTLVEEGSSRQKKSTQ
jgi:hypothetical protein